MAFPETPLDARLELHAGGQWVPVPTYARDEVTVSSGRGEQGTVTDPGNLSITINNRDGRFSPRNPESDLYGLIGRNTRCRLSLPGGEGRLELDGSLDGFASTPDTAALDITGDLDLRWEGEADWYRRGAQMLIGKWSPVAGERSYHLRIQDGSLHMLATRDGTSGVFANWVLPRLPRRAALRGVLDADNGAGAYTFRLYWAESLDGPWTQLGNDLVGTTTPVTIHSGPAPLVIAPYQLDSDPARRPMAGRVYRAEVRDGIDGTVVASPDFTAQPGGTTSFTDSAGLTWTLSGTATIRDRHDLFVGEVSVWPQKWTVDGSDAWVPIEASGILRRMGQGRKALQSTLRRRVPTFSPLAYWPMEEGEHATRAYSPIAGVPPLRLTKAKWAADDSLPSSGPLPTLNGSTGDPCHMTGVFPNRSFAALPSWRVDWVYKLDQPNTTLYTYMRVLSLGRVREWYIQTRDTQTRVIGRDVDGAEVFSHLIGTGSDLFGQWIQVALIVEQDGANVDWTIAWRDVGGDAGLYSNTFAGSAGRPTGVSSPPGGYAQDLNGMAIGHIAVWDTHFADGFMGAVDAYSGETAWERMRRLSLEEDLSVSLVPGPENPQRVGPQTPDRILNLLQAAADADGGLLLEDRHRSHRPGLVFRERSSMYNQTPAVVLSYDQAPGLAAPLEVVDDDTAVRNDRTVAREGGSEGRAVLEEGPLSVQDPPDGIGRYDDSVTLSLHDDAQTGPIAAWLLHLGTTDGPRYPKVSVMLHKAPELIPLVQAMTEGDAIRITGLPKWVGLGDIDLIVDGIHHAVQLDTWVATFNCSPGAPWQVAVVGDPVRGRVDANPGGSVLAAAAGAADTELLVHTASRGVRPPIPWITAWPVLTANPAFEEGLAGWTGNGCTIEWVAAPEPRPFAGAWAMKVTPDGVAEFPNAGSDTVPVVPGRGYVVSGWLRSATARSIDLNLNWFDAGGAYLSTSANGQAVQANTWTWFELAVLAPVGAVLANASPTVPTFPPATDVVWAHQVTIRPAEAGSLPREFPIPIRVAGEVMTATAITDSVSDSFGRTVAAGWGDTDTGQTWTVTGTAADYSVAGGYGSVAQPATGIAHLTQLAAPGPDVDLYVDVASSVLAAGSSLYAGPIVRANGNTDFYMARLDFTTAAGVALTLRRRAANVEAQLAAYASPLTHTAGTWYRVRLRVQGTELKAKVWLASAPEPSVWHTEATDAALTAAGNVGTRSYANTGSTPVNPALRYDNFRIVTPQRMTVQRSVNDVVKAQSPGTEVRLAHPAVIAL